MSDRAFIGYDLDNMIAAPASSTTIRTIFKIEDGVLICYGSPGHTDLEATTDVYAPGCIYLRSIGEAGSLMYINQGTKAVPNFVLISAI